MLLSQSYVSQLGLFNRGFQILHNQAFVETSAWWHNGKILLETWQTQGEFLFMVLTPAKLVTENYMRNLGNLESSHSYCHWLDFLIVDPVSWPNFWWVQKHSYHWQFLSETTLILGCLTHRACNLECNYLIRVPGSDWVEVPHWRSISNIINLKSVLWF